MTRRERFANLALALLTGAVVGVMVTVLFKGPDWAGVGFAWTAYLNVVWSGVISPDKGEKP